MDSLFKGYLKSNGKIPLQKVKEDDYYNLEEITSFDCDYVGILKDSIVMVDVDDMESANLVENIIENENINTTIIRTKRGKHFYFKNTDMETNKIHTYTTCGIEIDLKLGHKNTVVPVRTDGFNRIVMRESRNLDSLPCFLRPIKYGRDFRNSTSRNQDLFNYILTLQNENYNTKDIKHIITIINNYIFKNPLDSRELDVILRNEAFEKPVFMKKNKFNHDVFANWIIREKHVKRLGGILHMYKNNEYVDIKHISKDMIDLIPEIKLSQRTETIAYMEDSIIDDTPETSANFISVGNGILNIETDELFPNTPNIIIKNKITVKYNPMSYSQVVDETLNKITCHDSEIRMLLEEMIGYSLFRRNELGKFFILSGSGGNGKSTFLNMFTKLVGDKNTSYVSLKDCGDKFLKSDIVGKLINIGDDISSEYIKDNSDFKKLVTGERIQFQFKGQNAFSANTYAKMMFATNEVPNINDTSDGLMRRMVIIPFNAKFTSKDYDPFIADKLNSDEAMEYFLKIGIEGLKRVLRNKKFTESSKVLESMSEFETSNNTAMSFVAEGNEILNQKSSDVYLKYNTWCNMNGRKPMSNNKFGRVMKNKYNYTTVVKRINGVVIRLYQLEDDQNG